MRTANRNIDYLKKVLEQINKNNDSHEEAIRRMGSPKEIDAYFDVFTIAFAKWLLQRNSRTLEHSVEELLAEFRDLLSESGEEYQVDYSNRNFPTTLK